MPSAPPLPPLPVATDLPPAAPQPVSPPPVASMAPVVSAPVMPSVVPTPTPTAPAATEQGDDDWLSLLQKDEESTPKPPADVPPIQIATPVAQAQELTPPATPVVQPSL